MDRNRIATFGALIADLDGNGLELTTEGAGVLFDANCDGVRERIAWSRPQSSDVLVAVDLNHNGTIDGGCELLSSSFVRANGTNAVNGFQIIGDYYKRQLHSRQASVDMADPIAADMVLWNDANHDGVSQPGELRRCQDAGVTAIAAGYRRPRDPVTLAGNSVAFVGSMTLTLRGVGFPRLIGYVLLSGSGPDRQEER